MLRLELGDPPPSFNQQERMHWGRLAALTKKWRLKVFAAAAQWVGGTEFPDAGPGDKRLIRVIWRAKQKNHLPDKDNALASLKHLVTDNLRYKRYKRHKETDPETGERKQRNVLTPSRVAVIYDDDLEHADFEYAPEIAPVRELIVEIYEWRPPT